MARFKVNLDHINYGPKEEVDRLTALVFAQELLKQGYRRTSSAYCTVSRIDREDWLDVMAKQMRCARADFYRLDGFGIDDRWRDHYVRVQSKDKLTVHPCVSVLMKTY